jgi:hypothetical protein
MLLAPARRYTARLGALLLAAVALGASADSMTAEPIRTGEYGRDLLTTASIPVDAFVKGEDWQGAHMTMDSKKNPYTIVVTVEGTATADGDVSMLWSTGWATSNSNKQQPAMGRPVTGVKAGEHVVVRRAGAPGQFNADKDAAPLVSLVRVDNLRIEHVDVELWSGFARLGWKDWLFSLQGLALGGVMLVVAVLFLRR